MSRSVDNTEERMLAVITKCDQLLDDDDDVFQALTKLKVRGGYNFVRNRIDDETHEEAQIREATLFEAHPLLSKIEKSMVGIPALASRLVQIQLVIILKCFPDIVDKINEGINILDLELNQLPNNFMSKADGLVAFMHIIRSFTETLQMMFIKGEYNEYVDFKKMHCNARLIDMLDEFSKNLHSSVQFSESFLVEEMQVLEETNGIWLPHFLPHSFWIRRKMNNVSTFAILFVKQVWSYLEIVCARILIDHYGDYPQLLSSMRKATHNVIEKMKFEFMEKVVEMIEMEKTTYYTCDPDFVASWNMLISNRDKFMKAMCNHLEELSMEGHDGTVNVKHLFSIPENTRDQAFDLKMRMTAYWKIVLKRMVDRTALRLRFMIQKVVNKEMEMEIVNEMMMHGGGIEKMSEELSSTGKERVRLQRSIGLFQESKQIMEQVQV
ncbi:unnamed protein product [Lactuca virosa]|uniref:GED domain-containing protein n=1 Tax=Lactuca virosa TaxID=75947 RepID=A0AAU9PHZ4_9ASTR|nr:unnamed protein product [Lactuca virosa]